jgi:phosphomannomutase / phosphoglucomutase
MQINSHIFRGYDIRGIVGEDLTSQTVEHIARAFATFLKRKGIKRAVVGRDCRVAGEEYSRLFIIALNKAGINTFDIGMTLVGTLYWAQYHLDCKGGVYVTASHNPVDYNGFKLADDFSSTLVGDQLQDLRRMIEEEDYEESESLGKNKKEDIHKVYKEDIIKRLPVTKKFKVVIDASCSTPGILAPELLKEAGINVVESNCNVDPSFPVGTPDPTCLKVAQRLKEKVVSENADVGFSYDADGDRMGVVDNKGNIIWNDVLLSIFSRDVLQKNPGAIIMYNTLCSKVVEETIKENGGKPFMWRTGHSFLKQKNREVGADFIGELSGHFFFSADFYNHDDGLYSTMRLLNYLSIERKSLSSIVESLPKYFSSPEIKVYCAEDEKVAIIDKIATVLKQDFQNAKIIDDERAGDGVRIDFDESMFVIRYSQNAPYLTIKYEGKTKERYEFLRIYIKELLERYQEIDWSSDINVNVDSLTKRT